MRFAALSAPDFLGSLFQEARVKAMKIVKTCGRLSWDFVALVPMVLKLWESFTQLERIELLGFLGIGILVNPMFTGIRERNSRLLEI